MPSLPYWLSPGDDRPPVQIDDEVAEELRLHLDLLAEERMRQGVTPDDARQQAAERFGDFDTLLRRCRLEKQGDIPMLKRIQAVLTLLLLLVVVWLGVRDYLTAATTAQYMTQTTTLLRTIQADLAELAELREEARFTRQEPSKSPSVWEPPDDPNPKAILREAKEDARAQRFDVALAKHVWYHDRAAAIDPSLSAVRLSFGLGAWYELACVYEPAMERLEELQRSLESRAAAGKDLGSKFHDLAAINRTLGQPERTVKSFAALDAKNAVAAKRAFHFAKDALLDQGTLELYSKYVQGKRQYKSLEMAFEVLQSNGHKDAEPRYREGTTELVATLVKLGRRDEAIEIAKLAKRHLDDPGFAEEIDEALQAREHWRQDLGEEFE